MDGFSDRGSIPLTSILDIHVLVILNKSVECGSCLVFTKQGLFSLVEIGFGVQHEIYFKEL